MADKDAVDILMTFIQTSGSGVDAESSSIWDDTDTDMMGDFQTGCAFEVEDFKFSADLRDSEGKDGRGSGSSGRGGGTNALHNLPGRNNNANNTQKEDSTKRSSSFAGYLQTGNSRQYPADVKEITVTKQMESSSVTLLQNCLNAVPFKKAVLVKRKFTGNQQFHEAFLKLEFTEPLITGVDWDQGDVVKETLKFICRGITVVYRPQSDDGTLDPVGNQMTWTPQRKLASGGTSG
jgi:type VI protein secretion system component Hcp